MLAASCSAAEAIQNPREALWGAQGPAEIGRLAPKREAEWRRFRPLGLLRAFRRGVFLLGGGELAARLLHRGARRGGRRIAGDVELRRQLALAQQLHAVLGAADDA